MEPGELAKELKSSDIFIFTSRIESCSNALLEALHCGLPVVAPNSSSNPEVVGKRGLLYSTVEEIPSLVQPNPGRYREFQIGGDLAPSAKIAEMYLASFGAWGKKLAAERIGQSGWVLVPLPC